MTVKDIVRRVVGSLMFAIVLFCMLRSSTPALAQTLVTNPAPYITTNMFTGPRSERLNVVVFGDGYTASQQALFQTHVSNTVVNYMFTREPYDSYATCFNVFSVFAASLESGSDHPESGTSKDTYFSSTYNYYNIPRLLALQGTGPSRLYSLAGQFVPDYNIMIVIVNDTTYGGSGGSYALVSTHSSGRQIAFHEVGHSFGNLEDEYDTYTPGYSQYEAVNCTAQTNRTLIKWKAWIEESTPIPTPETSTYDAIAGLFQGCMYASSGWYRPHYNSFMKSLGRPTGQINSDQFVKRFYNASPDHIEPFRNFSPTNTAISVSTVTNLAFTVLPLQPSAHNLSVEWYVDGVKADGQTATNFSILSTALGNGSHSVSSRVFDATSLVRIYTNSYFPVNPMVKSVAWTLTLANQTAGSQAPVAQSQSVTTAEDVVKSITLVATDGDGDPLSYAVVGAPTHGSLTGSAPNLTYTPDLNYSGSDSFTFRASDGGTNSNVATVSITVTAVNDAPVISSASANPAAITLPATSTVMKAVASDVDSGSLTYTWSKVSGPGTVTFAPNGTSASSNSTATISEVGSYVLRVTVSDGSASDMEDVAVVLQPAGQMIVVDNADSTGVTLVGTWSLSTSVAGYYGINYVSDGNSGKGTKSVLFSPSLPMSGEYVVSVRWTSGSNRATNAPIDVIHAGGTTTFLMNQQVSNGVWIALGTFQFNAGTNGGVKVRNGGTTSYVIADAVGFTAVGGGGSNTAPVAQAQNVSTAEDTAKAITLVATDADGNPLTYAVVAAPSHGSLSGTAPNVTYTPSSDWNGSDSFTFRANDGSTNSNVATVSITVTAVNDAPVISSASANPAAITLPVTSTVMKAVALDVDSGSLTYTWSKVSGAGDVTFAPNGTSASSNSTATFSAEGSYVLRVTVSDGSASDTEDVAVSVNVAGSGALPSPWETSDIGSPAVEGSAAYSNGVFTITGSGDDIYSSTDRFRFVYQVASGDCDIRAQVTSIQNVNSWSKGGVMIRETLDANARNMAVVMTPSTANGASCQWRTTTGGSTSYMKISGLAAPYWVRIARTGDTLVGYCSPDGSSWTPMKTQTVTMASSVYIGMAITSHVSTNLCTATMDNVTATP